jgi:hypothetical protein
MSYHTNGDMGPQLLTIRGKHGGTWTMAISASRSSVTSAGLRGGGGGCCARVPHAHTENILPNKLTMCTTESEFLSRSALSPLICLEREGEIKISLSYLSLSGLKEEEPLCLSLV